MVLVGPPAVTAPVDKMNGPLVIGVDVVADLLLAWSSDSDSDRQPDAS